MLDSDERWGVRGCGWGEVRGEFWWLRFVIGVGVVWVVVWGSGVGWEGASGRYDWADGRGF